MLRLFTHFKTLTLGLLIGAASVWVLNFFFFAHRLPSLPALFQENIEYKFYAYATQVTGKQRLQVAKLQETAVIERTSDLKAFWMDLPRVVVRATVPVEYGFFIEMNQGWKFRLHEDTLFVDVPALSNSTPAVDVSQLKFEVVKGSLFRNESESLRKIQSELMGILVEKSIAHRALVKDQARKSIEGFVRGWLSQVTRSNLPEKIIVRFPDDKDVSENPLSP